MTLKTIKKKIDSLSKNALRLMDSHPMVTFFGFLGVLLVLVIIGTTLRKPAATAPTTQAEPTLVETYSFGESPKMTFTAKIDKGGVMNIYAQAAGIVQKVSTTEGKRVQRGTTLVSLSTTYQGGNVASLQRQIAEKNYDNATQNFDLQLSIINSQRDLANKQNTQANELRDITSHSYDETQILINQDREIIDALNTQMNATSPSDPAYLTLKQAKVQAESALLNLNASIRNIDYQSGDTNTPAQLSDASRDLTLHQLDLQERGLVLSRDIADLNLKLARVSESTMYPASPTNGVVQRVYVKVGQSVSPGTLIATIKADKGENTAVILVPHDIASQVSLGEVSEFHFDGTIAKITPRYISTEATDGNLYSLLYTIPAEYANALTNAQTVEVRVALGTKRIATDTLYVPLDSIYQTQEKSYVYILTKDGDALKAKTVEVVLGDISGQYVTVTSGLSVGDIVILSRSVQNGDVVRTQ